MYKAKQYYNFTYNYLLPDLYMTTKDKLIYLQQMITNKTKAPAHTQSPNVIPNKYAKISSIMMPVPYIWMALPTVGLALLLLRMHHITGTDQLPQSPPK